MAGPGSETTAVSPADALRAWIEGPLSGFLRADLARLTAPTESIDTKVPLLLAEFDSLSGEGPAFRKKIASARGKQEIPALENAIRMTGVLNAQCHLIVARLARGFASKLLPRDGNSGLVLVPANTVLAFAQRARAFVGEDSRYADGAFAAGLVYDLLTLHANSEQVQPPHRQRVLDLIATRFERGLLGARLGIALARRMKRLTLEEHVAPALLLHEAGTVVAGLLFPAHAERLKVWDQERYPYSLRVRAEERTLGASSAVFAETLALLSPALDQAGAAVAEVPSPFSLLASNERDGHDLAALARLAVEVLDRPELLASTDLVSAGKIRPELKALELKLRGSELAAEAKKK